MTAGLRCCNPAVLPLNCDLVNRIVLVKMKSYSPAIKVSELRPVHHIGPKAFFVEPLLILGSSILWLAVLPFAGLFWSGATLWKRAAHTLPTIHCSRENDTAIGPRVLRASRVPRIQVPCSDRCG